LNGSGPSTPDDDIYTLRITFDEGSGEVRGDEDHPLAAPFRRAMLYGAPTGALRTIVLHDGETPYLFGTAVATAGGRLLFCPAAEVVVSHEPSVLVGRRIEHITLDPARRKGRHKSHIAFQDGRRGEGWTTFVHDGHLIPWFSVLMSELGADLTLPRTIDVAFPRKRIDGDFAADLLGSSEAIVSVGLPSAEDNPSFLQFDFWAGMQESWRSLQSGVIPWAFVAAIAADVPQSQEVTPSRVAVEMEHGMGLVLVVTRIRGRLKGEGRLLRVGRWTPTSTPQD
jgi:hypothetical protein